MIPGFLKSYEVALAQSHLRPEAKLRNGHLRGPRDHSQVARPRRGARAHRQRGQLLGGAVHLRLDTTAQAENGHSPQGRYRTLEALARYERKVRQRKLAEAADVSLSEVSAVLLGMRVPRSATLAR